MRPFGGLRVAPRWQFTPSEVEGRPFRELRASRAQGSAQGGLAGSPAQRGERDLSLDLTLTVARIVFLALLYLFVLLVFKALVTEAAVGMAPRRRRRTRGAAREATARPPAVATPPDTAIPAPSSVARIQQEPGYVRPTPGPRLTVVETFDSRVLPVGTTFPLTAATTIGRGPHNTVVIRDPYASLDHAMVVAHGGRWLLKDRGSTNGTVLNGEAVSAEVAVRDGDRIRIGSTVLQHSE